MPFFVMGLIPFGAAAYFYFAAFRIIRRTLPHLNHVQARVEMVEYVWSPSAPAEARQAYVCYMFAALAAFFLFGLGLFYEGQPWGGAIFELMTLYGVGYLGLKLHRQRSK
jgi:hypothetical protein